MMDNNITCPTSVVSSAGDMKPKQVKNRIIDHLCLNFDEPIRDWLERREGYPQKVIQQGCPGASFRIATMGKSGISRSLIRGDLIQSCPAGAKNFTKILKIVVPF